MLPLLCDTAQSLVRISIFCFLPQPRPCEQAYPRGLFCRNICVGAPSLPTAPSLPGAQCLTVRLCFPQRGFYNNQQLGGAQSTLSELNSVKGWQGIFIPHDLWVLPWKGLESKDLTFWLKIFMLFSQLWGAGFLTGREKNLHLII